MRIALVSTLATTVSRTHSGSVEGFVWLMSRELTEMGHEVTVFAAAGSTPCGTLVATLPGTYAKQGAPDDWQLCEWINLCEAVRRSGEFDVIHAHAYLWGAPLRQISAAPMVHTLHVMPGEDHARLLAMYPATAVIGISAYQWSTYTAHPPVAFIHHAVDVAQFTFRASPSNYVCYLGRFTPGKGPLEAIAAARALGIRLVLAGPESPYFHQHVKPLVDGEHVQYVGSVTGTGRDELLGGARALLYPVRHPEPFGLVVAEAMMCGTPVAATGIGAVPELVDDGVTGSYSRSGDAGNGDFTTAITLALALDRHRVRERAEARFAPRRAAEGHVAAYLRVIGYG